MPKKMCLVVIMNLRNLILRRLNIPDMVINQNTSENPLVINPKSIVGFMRTAFAEIGKSVPFLIQKLCVNNSGCMENATKVTNVSKDIQSKYAPDILTTAVFKEETVSTNTRQHQALHLNKLNLQLPQKVLRLQRVLSFSMGFPDPILALTFHLSLPRHLCPRLLLRCMRSQEVPLPTTPARSSIMADMASSSSRETTTATSDNSRVTGGPSKKKSTKRKEKKM